MQTNGDWKKRRKTSFIAKNKKFLNNLALLERKKKAAICFYDELCSYLSSHASMKMHIEIKHTKQDGQIYIILSIYVFFF